MGMLDLSDETASPDFRNDSVQSYALCATIRVHERGNVLARSRSHRI